MPCTSISWPCWAHRQQLVLLLQKCWYYQYPSLACTNFKSLLYWSIFSTVETPFSRLTHPPLSFSSLLTALPHCSVASLTYSLEGRHCGLSNGITVRCPAERKAFCGLHCLSGQSPTGSQAQLASTDRKLLILPLTACQSQIPSFPQPYTASSISSL